MTDFLEIIFAIIVPIISPLTCVNLNKIINIIIILLLLNDYTHMHQHTHSTHTHTHTHCTHTHTLTHIHTHTHAPTHAHTDMSEGCVGDMVELGITESYQVKRQVLLSASEAAEMILRVDDIIKSAPR